MPDSSDPCSIYRELRSNVIRPDEHSAKIGSQKAMLSGLAVKLVTDGKISVDARDEILEMLKRATSNDWRPFLYVIPNIGFGTRLKTVPRERRASNEMEYIIEDLKPAEFHILEFP
jgi:hypothetical protein